MLPQRSPVEPPALREGPPGRMGCWHSCASLRWRGGRAAPAVAPPCPCTPCCQSPATSCHLDHTSCSNGTHPRSRRIEQLWVMLWDTCKLLGVLQQGEFSALGSRTPCSRRRLGRHKPPGCFFSSSKQVSIQSDPGQPATTCTLWSSPATNQHRGNDQQLMPACVLPLWVRGRWPPPRAVPLPSRCPPPPAACLSARPWRSVSTTPPPPCCRIRGLPAGTHPAARCVPGC